MEQCPECKKEFEEMGKFEEVMRKMELKKPPKEAWQLYWTSIYNRLERRAGPVKSFKNLTEVLIILSFKI